MRISDWSSDVCSSDLKIIGHGSLGDQYAGVIAAQLIFALKARPFRRGQLRQFRANAPDPFRPDDQWGQVRLREVAVVVLALLSPLDRQSVVSGKSLSVRVDLGGLRVI